MLTINPRAFGIEKDLRLSFQKFFFWDLALDGALNNRGFYSNLISARGAPYRFSSEVYKIKMTKDARRTRTTTKWIVDPRTTCSRVKTVSKSVPYPLLSFFPTHYKIQEYSQHSSSLFRFLPIYALPRFCELLRELLRCRYIESKGLFPCLFVQAFKLRAINSCGTFFNI